MSSKTWWEESIGLLLLLLVALASGVLLAMAFGLWLTERLLFFWRW